MTAGSDKHKLFEKIVEENMSRLRILSRTNAYGEDHLDLKQEIMLALWNSLDLYEGRSSPETWFYGVARKTILKFLRRNPPRIPETEMAVAEEPATYFSGQNRDPMAILKEFTRSLEGLDRVVFLMYLDDFSYREIAEVVKVDEASLRARISRMKKQYESRYVGS